MSVHYLDSYDNISTVINPEAQSGVVLAHVLNRTHWLFLRRVGDSSCLPLTDADQRSILAATSTRAWETSYRAREAAAEALHLQAAQALESGDVAKAHDLGRQATLAMLVILVVLCRIPSRTHVLGVVTQVPRQVSHQSCVSLPPMRSTRMC